jgi:hypothetical protein
VNANPDTSEGRATIARVKRRLQALGVKGNTGGWLCVNEPRVALKGCAPMRVQGWMDAARWAVTVAKNMTAWNMVEIRDGKRVGAPTLDAGGSMAEFALALCAPGPVYLRVGNDAVALDFNRAKP